MRLYLRFTPPACILCRPGELSCSPCVLAQEHAWDGRLRASCDECRTCTAEPSRYTNTTHTARPHACSHFGRRAADVFPLLCTVHLAPRLDALRGCHHRHLSDRARPTRSPAAAEADVAMAQRRCSVQAVLSQKG